MRVLFASTRGAGHFNPLVPFIEACRRKGHDIADEMRRLPPVGDALVA